MKYIRQIFNISLHNFRKWSTDYRIWTIGIIMILIVHENIRNLADIGTQLGVKSTLWFYPFLYCQYHMKLIFTLPLIMIYCNAPFVDSNTTFIIIRTKKCIWTAGQVLYIILSSAVYFIFVFLCTIIISLPYAEFTFEWGKLLNTLAYSNVSSSMGYNFINVTGYVITYFTPIQAVWFTFLLSWLSGILLGLIIYCFNIMTNTKYVGIGISGFIAIFSCFVAVFGGYKLLPYSPVSWSTLNNIDIGGYTRNPSFYYCVTIYIVISLVLATLCCLKNKNINNITTMF